MKHTVPRSPDQPQPEPRVPQLQQNKRRDVPQVVKVYSLFTILNCRIIKHFVGCKCQHFSRGQALSGADLILSCVHQSVHIPTGIAGGEVAWNRITSACMLSANILNVTTDRAYKPFKPRLQMLSILRGFLVNVLFKFFNVGQSKSLLSTRLSWRFASHLVVPVLGAPHKCRVIFTAWREVIRARRARELTVETYVFARLRPA